MKNIIGDVINCRYSGVPFATNTRFMPRKTEQKKTLDAFDRAILRILQDDNKTPQRTISEAVNLSAAAVQRRISALENAGVIARNSAVVNPDTIPLTITAIVELQLRDERAMTVDAAKTIFRNEDGHLFRHLRYTYTYDSENRVTSKEAFKWDSVKEAWVPYFKLDVEYTDSEVELNYARWNSRTNGYDSYTQTTVYELNDSNAALMLASTK